MLCSVTFAHNLKVPVMSALQGSIKLSDFFSLSEAEREEQLNGLVKASINPTEDQTREQTEALDARLRKFECRYEMSSDTMRAKLSNGDIKETADMCSWMLLIKARESFEPEPTAASPKSA